MDFLIILVKCKWRSDTRVRNTGPWIGGMTAVNQSKQGNYCGIFNPARKRSWPQGVSARAGIGAALLITAAEHGAADIDRAFADCHGRTNRSGRHGDAGADHSGGNRKRHTGAEDGGNRRQQQHRAQCA
jgi:hypothetical protein